MLFSAGFGILSAVVGAGFASGREIMYFFSRYGPWSWYLCILASGLMGGLTAWVMGETFEIKNTPGLGKALLLPLFAAVGGAMTAAAGELFALTLPLAHTRTLGALLTLGASALASSRSVRVLGVIGKILAPLMLLAFFFCARVTEEQGTAFPPSSLGTALPELLGYCGLNVTLSIGVICEAGQRHGKNEQMKITVIAAALLLILLLAGNAVLLPHAGALKSAPLPVVALLRNYGKPGFYLSAAVLYLAVFSTLTAIIQAMRALLPRPIPWRSGACGCLCGLASLLGFEDIVGFAYPVLGWLGLLLIFGRKFLKAGTIRRAVSSIGRTPNKEENNG